MASQGPFQIIVLSHHRLYLLSLEQPKTWSSKELLKVTYYTVFFTWLFPSPLQKRQVLLVMDRIKKQYPPKQVKLD